MSKLNELLGKIKNICQQSGKKAEAIMQKNKGKKDEDGDPVIDFDSLENEIENCHQKIFPLWAEAIYVLQQMADAEPNGLTRIQVGDHVYKIDSPADASFAVTDQVESIEYTAFEDAFSYLPDTEEITYILAVDFQNWLKKAGSATAKKFGLTVKGHSIHSY